MPLGKPDPTFYSPPRIAAEAPADPGTAVPAVAKGAAMASMLPAGIRPSIMAVDLHALAMPIVAGAAAFLV